MYRGLCKARILDQDSWSSAKVRAWPWDVGRLGVCGVQCIGFGAPSTLNSEFGGFGYRDLGFERLVMELHETHEKCLLSVDFPKGS